MDRHSRVRWLVILGFTIGGCYTTLTTKSIPAFVVLYSLLQATGYTVGLISAESFLTALGVWGMEFRWGFGKAGARWGRRREGVRSIIFCPRVGW